MQKKVLRKMENEVQELKRNLMDGGMTEKQMVDFAYQYVVKNEIYYAMMNHADMISEKEWKCLYNQEDMGEYLYDLWMKTDIDFTEELAEVLHGELGKYS